jgi:hypothetical protein
MNIRQAKQRFTELTGLPATRKNVNKAIWEQKGYVADWFSFAEGYTNNNIDIFDSRTKNYWITIVKYLEALQEIA